MSSSESGLIAAAVDGDQAALQRLLVDHYPQIWRVCRRLMGNDADADDATQEAMVRIAKNLGKFNQRSRFSTWAYRVATNCSLDELRKRSRRSATSLDHAGAGGTQLEVVDLASSSAVDRLVDQSTFDRALQNLPDDFRVPLVLRDVATLSYDEIAEELGISLGTVKSRIARARKLMLTNLRDAGNHLPPPSVQHSDSHQTNE